MRRWSTQERQRQSELIKTWKPWRFGGVKTKEGKLISRMNALKNGGYTEEIREAKKMIARLNRVTRKLGKQLYN